MAPRVTLTTDFGTRDSYAAAMKGVVSSICPDAVILDLTHEIAPQNILEGALFLAGAVPYFPSGTIHLGVVDPGVGSERRAIAVRAGGQVFVGPDNGLFSLVLRASPIQEARVLAEPRFMRPIRSDTFHGRDVFAPVAAHLAAGIPLHELGPVAKDLATLALPEPVQTEDGALRGVIVHVDRFGNLITNIPRVMIPGSLPGGTTVRAGSAKALPLRRVYSEVSSGTALALFGSSDYLEIAVNGGSAATELKLDSGESVEVIFPG